MFMGKNQKVDYTKRIHFFGGNPPRENRGWHPPHLHSRRDSGRRNTNWVEGSWNSHPKVSSCSIFRAVLYLDVLDM